MPNKTSHNPQGLNIPVSQVTTAVTINLLNNVDEKQAAIALGLSVHTLRKDRQTNRRFPFYRFGGRIVYNLDRLKTAMANMEEGGITQTRRAIVRAAL